MVPPIGHPATAATPAGAGATSLTSDAGSGFVTPPPSTGKSTGAAPAARGTADVRSNGGGGGVVPAGGSFNLRRRQQDKTRLPLPPSLDPGAVPETQGNGTGDSGGAWQWINHGGKSASGKFYRTTSSGGGGKSRAARDTNGGSNRIPRASASFELPAVSGQDALAPYATADAPRKGSGNGTNYTEAEKKKKKKAGTGQAERQAFHDPAHRRAAAGIRRLLVEANGRHRRSSSGSGSRHRRPVVGAPENEEGGVIDSSSAAGEEEPTAARQNPAPVWAAYVAATSGAAGRVGNGSGSRGTLLAHGGSGNPAATGTGSRPQWARAGSPSSPIKPEPWNWKMLSARNSTASTSAMSINSVAPTGPSSLKNAASSGSGSGSGSGSSPDQAAAVATTANLGEHEAQLPQQSSPALVPSTSSSTAGRGARPSVGKPTAAAAAAGSQSEVRAYPKMRLSGGGISSAAPLTTVPTTAAAVAAAAVKDPLDVGGPDGLMSRPPPAPGTSSQRPNIPVSSSGEHRYSGAAGNGRALSMPPPSPGGSSDGVAAPPTAIAGKPSSGVDSIAVDAVDGGESNAGGFSCLDSAGGGSFEVEMYDSITVSTPPLAAANVNGGGNDDDEGDGDEANTNATTSDGFDSGFEAIVATPRDGDVGAMTEGEIVAAAEAAMRSAQKATAGTVQRSPLAPVTPPPATSSSAAVGVFSTAGATGGGAIGVGRGSGDAGLGAMQGRRAGEESKPATREEIRSTPRRIVRDDNWWRESAAKVIADKKKTPVRVRGKNGGGGAIGRAVGRAGGAAQLRGTPSRRGGVAAAAGRGAGPGGVGEGGGGGAPSVDTAAAGGGGGLVTPGVVGGDGGHGIGANTDTPVSEEGYLSPPRTGTPGAAVSPAFSTISSREQAERDRERLAAIAGGSAGYRRSSWGISALPSNNDNNNHTGGGGGVTDTPGGYDTDEGYFNNGGGSRRRRSSRASYRSRESSGWGLTSDDGGEWDYQQQRRRRPSQTSPYGSGGTVAGHMSSSTLGGESRRGDVSGGDAWSDGTGGGGGSAGTSLYSDQESRRGYLSSTSSRSSMSTGYESSAMGEPASAAADDHRDSAWERGSGSLESTGMAPTPAADASPSQDGDGPYAYPPPSPAGSLSIPVPLMGGQKSDGSVTKLERSALERRAHYEANAAAAEAAAAASAAVSEAAQAAATAERFRSGSLRSLSNAGSQKGPTSRGSNRTPAAAAPLRGRTLKHQRTTSGRMPSETRAILSRGGSLPDFAVFNPRSESRGNTAATGAAAAAGAGDATRGRSSAAMDRKKSTVSEGATASRRRGPDPAGAGNDRVRQQHASAEEAMARAAAWTPSILLSRRGQEDNKRSAVSGGRRERGARVPRTDSQYFFSSCGSSVRGMSPAGIVQDHRQRYAHPSPAEEPRRHESGGGGSGSRGRRSREPLPTRPAPEEREQRRRRQQQQASGPGAPPSASGEQGQEDDRLPLAIPPLPKVLFRPPTASRQQRSSPAASTDARAVPDRGDGDGDGGGYYIGDPGLSFGRWSSYAGTPTSTVFSPASAVANPFIATRFTVRSGQSAHNGSHYGGSERGSTVSAGVDQGGARRVASWSKMRAHPLPRGLRVQGKGDFGGERLRGETDDGGYYGDDRGYGPTGGPARPGRMKGGAADHSSGSSTRRASSNGAGGNGHPHGDVVASLSLDDGVGSESQRTNTAATRRSDGSMSDVGAGDRYGTSRNNNRRSGSRAMLRTMSLRGRSFFAGSSSNNAGLGERRSVSMSSFRGRGEFARSGGGEYGGRGVANRVCSALSVSWLFSKKRSKKDPSTLKRRGGKSKSSGSSRGTSGSGGSRRTTTAFSGAGVVGVVDAGGECSSSDEGYDGDVFEIGGPLDIAVGVTGARRSYGAAAAAAAAGGFGGPSGGVVDDGGGSSMHSVDGGTPGGSSLGTGASGSLHGAKRMSFTRSAFLGFNRNAHRSMSSYSFVQHDPTRGASVGGAGRRGASTTGAADGEDADPTAEDGPGSRQREASEDPSHSVASPARDAASVAAGSTAASTNKAGEATGANGGGGGGGGGGGDKDDVQYVNFNGHGGRGGGVVALRPGDGVAAVEVTGDSSAGGGRYTAVVDPSSNMPEEDEEEAKKRMDALLLRSRVYTHQNPIAAAGSGGGGFDKATE
eukprot:g18523.t1